MFDAWFRPKNFESERLYRRMGALLLKRYVPTGGDIIMQRLRRAHPRRALVERSLESLRRYETRTRVAEGVHVLGFVAFGILILAKVVARDLTGFGCAVASILDLTVGLWPVVLQRYNRLRVYRVLKALSSRGS